MGNRLGWKDGQIAALQLGQLLIMTDMVISLASTIAQQAYPERFHLISSPVPRVPEALEWGQGVLW